MEQLAVTIIILVVLGIIFGVTVLPIVALVIAIKAKRRVETHLGAPSSFNAETFQQLAVSDLAPLATAMRRLESRVERVEAALAMRPVPIVEAEPSKHEAERPAAPVPDLEVGGEDTATQAHPVVTVTTKQAADIESIIGRRWLGWVAVSLILFATAFFLKHAFDNRWIGELGRVAIGVAAGVSFTLWGFKYHQRRWRIFSQILTACGIVLLYLSVFAAFGYYHLVTQKAAFVYLLIVVGQAAGLAVLYNAQAIAIMALIGGFLTPVLLHSGRDQYRALFGYIAVLDIGTLALPKHWVGLNSLAFAGTHLLFWLWYADNYHPQKLGAVMTFHTGVFLIFLLAPLGRRLIKRQSTTFEDLCLWPINAFVFFATAYHLLKPEYRDWMGALAIVVALIYSGAAKILLDRAADSRVEVLTIIAVALTFVTLAIPIQLDGNWITIAWSIQALTMLWASIKTSSTRLEAGAGALFILALGKLLLWDSSLYSGALFTPVLNRYFLSSLVLIACLFGAASLYQKLETEKRRSLVNLKTPILLIALATLWFVMSVETFTYFRSRAFAMKEADDLRHHLWLGQMALSVLWSIYAGVLALIGFVRRAAAVRWAALGLFGLTVIKVMLVDIAQLKQFYRVIAFLVLGVLLLVVAWAYNKAFRNKEASK